MSIFFIFLNFFLVCDATYHATHHATCDVTHYVTFDLFHDPVCDPIQSNPAFLNAINHSVPFPLFSWRH